MGGKLLGILFMALAAIFAFKWLRGQNKPPRPPAPRREQASSEREERPEKVIELERGKDGVYRPRDE